MDEFAEIELRSKPGIKLSYRLSGRKHTPSSAVLVVFINGLGLPQTSWDESIATLMSARENSSTIPRLLTYDRFGQGQTKDRDPKDATAIDPSHGHDCLDAVSDLHQLINQVAETKMPGSVPVGTPLVLVANSIGGALARLYAQSYPETVAGILFLDSVLANSDFVSVFPDPDEEGFDVQKLPAGVTPGALRTAREGVKRIFHPNVGSKEGLSRKNLAGLLPDSDGPTLKGYCERPPWITVAGHDFEAFVAESAKMGRPELLTREYVNPYWHRYNQGLAKLTDASRSRGPIQAPGAGHFIQKDNPAFVADEICRILDAIATEGLVQAVMKNGLGGHMAQ